MDKQELIDLIHEAFNGVTRAGGVSLHETEVIDDYGTDEERAEARKKDRDSKWQAVPHGHLAEICGVGGICFFDVIGWKYYLPAYMTWYLLEGHRSDSFAASQVFYTLQPSPGDLASYSNERYQSLNTRQTIAVKSFLEFVASKDSGLSGDDHEDAQVALDSYWKDI